MKNFSENCYWDYYKKCPIATGVEDIMNTGGNPNTNLVKLTDFARKNGITPEQLGKFLMACIGYWSETPYYDGRNAFAVLTSRKIAGEFPHLKTICDDENLLLNAFGFTLSAHRYLQNELFKTILEYFKVNVPKIYEWWSSKDFVYNDDMTDLVEYKSPYC